MANPLACPKCSYERTAKDTGPVTQCPNCQLVFAKYQATLPKRTLFYSRSESSTESSTSDKKPSTLRIVTGAIVIIVLVSQLFGKLSNSSSQGTSNRGMQYIYDQVISDALKQYDIVKRNGGPIDICVHAGLVSAAYIQAQQESKYREWKTIEDSDCKAAGLLR